MRSNFLTAARELSQRGDIEVSKDAHCKRSGYWSGGHDKRMRGVLCFSLEGLALPDAETMLLIDDDKPEVKKRHILADQSMCSDYQPAVSGGQIQHCFLALRQWLLAG